MKKRLLASLLAAAMTLTMAPAAFAADDDTAVQSNDPTASSIQIEDANTLQYKINHDTTGKVIVLNQDYEENITIGEGEHTIDLNNHKITNKDGQNTITVAKGATLTIEGEGTVDNVSHGKAAIWNNGTCTLNGGTYDRSEEKGVDANNNGGNSYYTVLNHGSMTVNEGVTVNNKGGFSSLFENGYQNYGDQYKEAENSNAPELTINGGTFTGGLNTIKNDDAATLTINGGTFTNYKQAAFQNHGTATVTDGKFTAESQYSIDNCGCDAKLDPGKLDISGGTFVGTLNIRSQYSDVTISGGNFNGAIQKTNGKLAISGGTFSTNPKDYLASGYAVKQADLSKNEYVVTPVSADEAKKVVDAEVKSGETEKTVSSEIENNTEKKAAANQITVAPAENTALPAEDASGEEKAAAITKLGLTDGTIPEGTTVTVTKTTYLAVEITDIDVTDDTATVKMEITPKYDLTATKETEGEQPTTAELTKGQEYEVTAPTKVVVKLPDAFKGKKVYISHKDDIYVVTANDECVVEFTTNGFSPFEFSLTAKDAVAEVGDAAYKDFQSAVSAAKDGDTVYVIKADTEYKGTISGTSKTVKVKNGTAKDITVTINGTAKTIKPDETESFTYTKSSGGSSGGGSSSSSSTSTVSASKANNGSISLDKTSASKGSTVTITVKPDKGYKLDKLTVTDSKGNTITVTNKGNNKYTFTMPDGKVTVTPTFVAEQTSTEQPSDTKSFSDVKSADWFASAVDYVVDKGMMNGVGNNKFAPNDSTTRGMLMTVIARYAGQDTTGSNPWYQKGMEWAKSAGVSDGTAPNANITREQLVTMLYRYAKSAGKDVSIGEDTNILSYTDATTVSEYAIPAMQWACGAGIVNGSNGKLLPKNNATRAEVAAILMRFCENVK